MKITKQRVKDGVESFAPSIEGEKPLVILKPNQARCTSGVIIMILILLYYIFGIILPVLMTGDYATMWISSNKGIIFRIAIFYTAWFAIPGILFFLMTILHSAGTYYFYHDRLELCTYWIRRKIIIPYNQMYVIRRNMGVNITKQKLPAWSNPLKRLKIIYWDGIGFGTNFEEIKVAEMKTGLRKAWVNPEEGPKALTILKEKAFSYIDK